MIFARKPTYILFQIYKKIRSAFPRFRLSSHDLAIECGRYDDNARNRRLCKFCNLNVIENEYHFLLVCPFYMDIRRQYFNSYYCHWPSLLKFEKLMSVTSKRKIIKT